MGGIEWMIEAFGCSPAALRNAAKLQMLFEEIVREMRLKPVGTSIWHEFPGGGVTGVWLLQESHLAVHSFPEYESLCLNLFCCKPRAPFQWDSRLKTLLEAQEITVREYARAYDRQAQAAEQ